LEQQKDRHPWKVVRIAKDPFGTKTTISDLIDKGGNRLQTQEEIVEAFQRHYLVTTGEPPHTTPHVIVSLPLPYRRASNRTIHAVRSALANTSNNSSQGPSRINYRLLKLIKDTPLGAAVINDTAATCEGTKPPRVARPSDSDDPQTGQTHPPGYILEANRSGKHSGQAGSEGNCQSSTTRTPALA
jgi:hypothetical protein